MKITVVGGMLILVAVMVGAFLILALNENKTVLDDQQHGGYRQDQSPQQRTGG